MGYSFIKNGSAIPTADGVSDTCDCPAGYYLDNTGLNCNECPAGQTSAGGRVTECYSAPASSCTTSQYLKDGACVACPPSTGVSSSHPSATSTGGSATFCTCPENYYAFPGIDAPTGFMTGRAQSVRGVLTWLKTAQRSQPRAVTATRATALLATNLNTTVSAVWNAPPDRQAPEGE